MDSITNPQAQPDFQILLGEAEAARLLGVSTATLARRRRNGQGPEFVRFGAAVRYSKAALESFVATSTVKPREENGAQP